MSKHTPAPWKLVEHPKETIDWVRYIVDPRTNLVITKIEDPNPTASGKRYLSEEKIANAHLITAAPEMLTILRTVDVWLDNQPNNLGGDIRDMVRSAIAKAEGEQ